ncbi:MAG: hypothetical protein HZB61_13570 [Nitrospirae bacterium]|nr:hypothetical protein [Nitrospirota bacterium]
MTTQESTKIFRHIIPNYDEITLFAMGFTCGLLLIAGIFSANWQISKPLSRDDLNFFVLAALFLTGLVFSIYHAFTVRPKKSFEKLLMLFFAVILNAASGIMAGTYFLKDAQGWLVIFPIINIIDGALLLIMLRARIINEDNIDDENAARRQVAFTGALIIILFTVCQFIFDLLWMQTLSICVVYSSNLNRGVQTLIARLLSRYRFA